jgi:hypothetical protein
MTEGDEKVLEGQESVEEEVVETPEEAQPVEEESVEETNSDVEKGKEDVMMEEREEKVVAGEESKFLTYAAVGLAIVALFFSFWGFSTQLKEKKLEEREAALEKKVADMGKAQLVSDFTLKAAQVYMLTMVDHNYAAAQKVVAEMRAEANAFGNAGSKLNALLDALEAEVKKGPSPIPGLVNALSSEVKTAAGGAATVAPVGTKAAAPVAKLKVEAAPAKPEAKKEEQAKEAKKEKAAPAKKVLSEPPRPTKEAGGLTSKLFHMWQSLSPYSDSK